MRHRLALAVGAAIALSGVAYAQSTHDHRHEAPAATDTAATTAYKAANAKMHTGMDINFPPMPMSISSRG